MAEMGTGKRVKYHRDHHFRHNQKRHQHQHQQQQVEYYNPGGEMGIYHHQPSPTSSGTTSRSLGMVFRAEDRKTWGPCLWILAVLFVVVIVMLVICLIVFFTVGSSAQSTTTLPSEGESIQELSTKNAVRRSESHNDYVSPEEVYTAIKRGKPKFCVFDTEYEGKSLTNNSEGYTAFRKEHIPTALHFNIEAVIRKSDTQRRNLIHPLEFEKYARELGIDADCRVVLYDHGNLMSTTYSWWLFKVYGHRKVSIINGGLKQWKAKNLPTTSQAPQRPQGYFNFLAKWDPDWIVTFDDVMRNFDDLKFVMVDARSAEYFFARKKKDIARYGGRIKGAINVHFEEFLKRDGLLKGVPDLKKIFRDYGLDRRRPAVAYCNTGISASILYFAMIQSDIDAKLYDGGWVEWSYRAPREFSEVGPFKIKV